MELLFERITLVVVEPIPAVFDILAGIYREMLFAGLWRRFRNLAEAFNRRKRRNPFLAVLGYLLWGTKILSMAFIRFLFCTLGFTRTLRLGGDIGKGKCIVPHFISLLVFGPVVFFQRADPVQNLRI